MYPAAGVPIKTSRRVLASDSWKRGDEPSNSPRSARRRRTRWEAVAFSTGCQATRSEIG